MATTKHAAYGTHTSALTTELNALANNTNSAASSAIDNTSNLDLYADIELVIGTQTARSTGAAIAVFAVHATDGTNYGDVNEITAELLCVFPLDAATTARRATVRDVPLPPGLFKLFARNLTGQALAATANTIKYRPHNISTA